MAGRMPAIFVVLICCVISAVGVNTRARYAQQHASQVDHISTGPEADDDKAVSVGRVTIVRQPKYGGDGFLKPKVRSSVKSNAAADNDDAQSTESEDAPRQASAGTASGITGPRILGAAVFAIAMVLLTIWCGLFFKLRIDFMKHHVDREETTVRAQEARATFLDYLEYTLVDWFNRNRAAPSLILVQVFFGVIILVTLLYWLLVGEAPHHGLYRVFNWTSASAAGGETDMYGRILGGFATCGGIVIIAMLMGLVTEAHTTKMEEFKLGLNKVVEGGHTVICGFTDCTPVLLAELALARENDEKRKTVVLLTIQPKAEVEDLLFAWGLDMKKTKLIVRSGKPWNAQDLLLANVDAADEVLLLRDTDVSGQEADAKNVRAVLAMKSRKWPISEDARVIVQCSAGENRSLFNSLNHDMEIVVIAEFISRFMVQCALHPGLANVYTEIMGFEGDEFYIREWPNLVGLTFLEVVFRFPAAVVMGVFTFDGKCKLNPGFGYEIADGDKIIVLAEDDDTYTAEEAPFFDFTNADVTSPMSMRNSTMYSHEKSDKAKKVLMIGWNMRGPAFMMALQKVIPDGAKVDIYSCKSAESRTNKLKDLETHYNDKFTMAITQHEVPNEVLSSYAEVEKMQHWDYDSIFMFCDDEEDAVGTGNSDERAITVLSQMQRIYNYRQGCLVPKDQEAVFLNMPKEGTAKPGDTFKTKHDHTMLVENKKFIPTGTKLTYIATGEWRGEGFLIPPDQEYVIQDLPSKKSVNFGDLFYTTAEHTLYIKNETKYLPSGRMLTAQAHNDEIQWSAPAGYLILEDQESVITGLPKHGVKPDDVFKTKVEHKITVKDEAKTIPAHTKLTARTKIDWIVEGLPCKPFDPVVEICEDNAQEQLEIQGIKNIVNHNAMKGQALAAVLEDPGMNEIYQNMMEVSTLDIARLETLWPAKETVPPKLTFALVAYKLSVESNCLLVGWSEPDPTGNGKCKWVVNPKEKLKLRHWSHRNDQVVILRPSPLDDDAGSPGSNGSRRRKTLFESNSRRLSSLRPPSPKTHGHHHGRQSHSPS